jgi:hypothetical protein
MLELTCLFLFPSDWNWGQFICMLVDFMSTPYLPLCSGKPRGRILGFQWLITWQLLSSLIYLTYSGLVIFPYATYSWIRYLRVIWEYKLRLNLAGLLQWVRIRIPSEMCYQNWSMVKRTFCQHLNTIIVNLYLWFFFFFQFAPSTMIHLQKRSPGFIVTSKHQTIIKLSDVGIGFSSLNI